MKECEFRILAVNPGSTSTKIAVFDDERPVYIETLHHSIEELEAFGDIFDQHEFRKTCIRNSLTGHGIQLESLDAVVGRGGLVRPIPSGVYLINDRMIRDLKKSTMGKHASSLAGLIAHEIAKELKLPAFVVDPVVVDEMEPEARISGLPEIERKSIFHALNQKAVARRAARDLGSSYEELNFVVAHIGGGVSVGAHRRGRVVDVNNALDGEGPFTPQRAGTLPVTGLIKLCYSGKYTEEDLLRIVVREAGLVAYLGTNDGREVEKRIREGDEYAEFVFKSMAYQISKEIGRCCCALDGEVDAILLTGGLAHSELLVRWIRRRVEFLAKVLVYPGENELEALALGALRVLRGEEPAKTYQ